MASYLSRSRRACEFDQSRSGGLRDDAAREPGCGLARGHCLSKDRNLQSRRPQVHFTPPQGWINDPCGLVFAEGRYHLYYQYNPHSTSWGPMHWGHAVSADLITWEHRPIALYPDEHGLIFSGSAVIDESNTAGCGTNALAAFFTYHGFESESQASAWSIDGGETFEKSPNPILNSPDGVSDFRDPRVFWYSGDRGVGTGKAEGRWIMLVAAGKSIEIYSSSDLARWSQDGSIRGIFSANATWEMPELLRFVDGGEAVWVLVASISDGAPALGSGVQAVAGHFDGADFAPLGDAFWIDCGPAFYAPQAWIGLSAARRTWIGWMGNWNNTTPDPNASWNGQMSIPRDLSLAKTRVGYRLIQTPVAELAAYRRGSFCASADELPDLLDKTLPISGCALDVLVETDPGSPASLVLDRTDQGPSALIEVEANQVSLILSTPDGARSTYYAERIPTELGEQLRVIVDAGSIEVFAGPSVISARVPVTETPWCATLPAGQFEAAVSKVEIHSVHC